MINGSRKVSVKDDFLSLRPPSSGTRNVGNPFLCPQYSMSGFSQSTQFHRPRVKKLAEYATDDILTDLSPWQIHEPKRSSIPAGRRKLMRPFFPLPQNQKDGKHLYFISQLISGFDDIPRLDQPRTTTIHVNRLTDDHLTHKLCTCTTGDTSRPTPDILGLSSCDGMSV